MERKPQESDSQQFTLLWQGQGSTGKEQAKTQLPEVSYRNHRTVPLSKGSLHHGSLCGRQGQWEMGTSACTANHINFNLARNAYYRGGTNYVSLNSHNINTVL